MLDLLPAALWCVSMIMSIGVIWICTVRGRLMHAYAGGISPVRWPVVFVHVASLVVGTMPYLVFMWYAGDDASFTPDMRDFYQGCGGVSVAVFLITLMVQWLCMYRQADRAWRSETDARLRRPSGTALSTSPFSASSVPSQAQPPRSRWTEPRA